MNCLTSLQWISFIILKINITHLLYNLYINSSIFIENRNKNQHALTSDWLNAVQCGRNAHINMFIHWLSKSFSSIFLTQYTIYIFLKPQKLSHLRDYGSTRSIARPQSVRRYTGSVQKLDLLYFLAAFLHFEVICLCNSVCDRKIVYVHAYMYIHMMVVYMKRYLESQVNLFLNQNRHICGGCRSKTKILKIVFKNMNTIRVSRYYGHWRWFSA